MRPAGFLLVTALAVSSAYGGPVCAVTQPPPQVFVPLPPFAASPEPGHFYFGSDDFWTILPDNGTWGTQHDQPTYDRRKISWFSSGYWWLSEPQPNVTIIRRLPWSRIEVHALGDGVFESIQRVGKKVIGGFHPD